MPFKDILRRPSTSGGSKKRYSTFEPAPSLPSSSSKSPERTRSPKKGHSKIGSLHRLSLSFPRGSLSHDGTFHQFLAHEPSEVSRQNSLAKDSTPNPGTTTSMQAFADIEHPQSHSVPVLQSTSEEKEPDIDDEPAPRPERFSLMKFKHASEPQLSTRYKEKEPLAAMPAVPLPPPQIITTAPTQHMDDRTSPRKKERLLPRTFSSFRKSMVIREEGPIKPNSLLTAQHTDGAVSSPNLIRAMSENNPWKQSSEITSPPAYGDDSNTLLATPVARMSESGGSEGSSGSHKLYAQTTTTHFIETTTTIFKLKRNKKKSKDKGPLFPLPERLPAPGSSRTSISHMNDSNSGFGGRKSMSPSRRSTQAIRWHNSVDHRNSPLHSPNASATALTNAPLGSPGPAISRMQTQMSRHSGNVTPTGSHVPPRLGARGRSSTMGSLGRSSDRLVDVAPSGRTSTSTAGRRSFGDILTQRLRKDSAPPRHGSASGSTPGSNKNSFQLGREEPELVYPQREEEDTPASYLEKLEAAVPRGAMATILCKSNDEFAKTCLRKYMRGFSYFGESIDISIRKMLMEVILPKETQQIDRLLAGFADRYHECNPGIFVNADEANFVAFSILLLQSDNHNKNNKRKMTRQDYVKNTQHGRISVGEDVLECFYDNVCYTPFIHFDDEVAVNNHRLSAPKRKAALRRTKSSEMIRGPVDPYTLILDNKLDVLRPSLKEVIETEDTYITVPVSTNENHKAFVQSAILQIISARSRPEAFANQATITNPAEAQAGIVSIKVAKVGLLWRKSTKKKKAKSPWQEWGVVLTDSKLYFFKDLGWAKKLVTQYETYVKSTSKTPLVFRPPLTSFEPDAWMSMEDAVALIDSSYKRHKNAFTFIKHGGFEEVFLANSDTETLDWVSKLNYAATFRTAGVRMRGLLGTNYEGRNLYRKDSEISVKTDTSHATDQNAPVADKPDPQIAWEIMFYRRQLVSEKISAFDDHVANAQKELDYLLRNARHLLILLPVQQKSREGIVYAAGRMNAKLKWTRKEIWRAKTHRDILVKDLEAEASHAFPAPASAAKTSALNTPAKTTPTKALRDSLIRSDTEQTIRTNATKSPAIMTPAITPGSTTNRRPSQTILEHIKTSTSEPPELSQVRRRSAGSLLPTSPRLSPRLGDDNASEGRGRTPSIRTETSHRPSVTGNTDVEAEETSMNLDGAAEQRPAPGSDTEKAHRTRHNLPHLHTDGSLKERAGSVRRSLQRTLRESSGHHGISPLHLPHHSRSKRGKESGSSMAATEDGRSIVSGESEELKRDPTGRFVLHGKKASVITMGLEWQLSTEDRVKLREQMLKEQEVAAEDAEDEADRTKLRIDTASIAASRKSVDASVASDGDVSPTATPHTADTQEANKFSFDQNRKSMAESRFSAYSAVTAPTPGQDVFHSAASSPRLQRYQHEHEREHEHERHDPNDSESENSESGSGDENEESTFVVKDFDGLGIVPKRSVQEIDATT